MQNYDSVTALSPTSPLAMRGVPFGGVSNANAMSERPTAEPRGKASFLKIKKELEKAMQSLCTQLDGKHSG